MQVEVDLPGRVRADLTAEAGEVLVVIGPNGAG
jgi:ABC-type hemin transport system ATPase subunit